MKVLKYSFSGVQWLFGGCLLNLLIVILPAAADCSEFAVDDSDDFGHNSDCSYDTGLNRAVHKALNAQPEAESKLPESKSKLQPQPEPKLSTLGMSVKATSVERELLADASEVHKPKYSAMKVIELAPAASAQQLSQSRYQALHVMMQQCPQGFTVYAEKYAQNALVSSKNNNLKAISSPDNSATSASNRVGNGLQLRLVYQCD